MESLLLVLVLSMDAFVASIAYGSNKIKIPLLSITIINIICALFLTLSIFLGSIVKNILPEKTALTISFIILLCLGIYYLFESLIKTYLEEKSASEKKIKFRLFDIWFIIDVYVDETKADVNRSKNLDAKEALYLATALSLDSVSVGFGSSLGNINYLYVIVLSLIIGIFAIGGGLSLGRRIVEKSRINLSWLSGILLIALAILKII